MDRRARVEVAKRARRRGCLEQGTSLYETLEATKDSVMIVNSRLSSRRYLHKQNLGFGVLMPAIQIINRQILSI